MITALLLTLMLDQPWLSFSSCEGILDVPMTRALVDLEGPPAVDHHVDVACKDAAHVNVDVPKTKRQLDLHEVDRTLRPQFLAIAIAGAVADLRILEDAHAERFASRQTLRVTGGFALGAAIVGTVVALTGMGLILADKAIPPTAVAQTGVALIASGGTFTALAAIPLTFWILERKLPLRPDSD